MLQFFRINDPYRLVFVFLLLVILRTAWAFIGLPLAAPELKWLLVGERLGDGYTLYNGLYDHTGPLAAFIYKWIDILFGRARWLHISLSTLVITVQAGLLNRMLLRNKAFDENNYLPAFFYAILMAGIPDFMVLSPQLMSLTFVLFALSHIFRRIDNVVTDELFLFSGIHLGLAVFFYLPSGIFVVVFLLSFVLFTSAVGRRVVLFAFGVLVVFVPVWANFYWFGASGDFLQSFYIGGLSTPRIFHLTYEQLIRAAPVLIGTALFSFSALFTLRVTNFQQKMQQVMLLMFLGSGVVVFLSREVMPADLVFFIPTIAYFLVYFYFGLRRKVFKWLLPYTIILGLIAFPFFWVLKGDTGQLIVTPPDDAPSGERILGIGLPLDYYIQNEFSGPFLIDYLSQQKLEGLDYYEEASELYFLFEQSDATLIMDRSGVMPKVLDRFPGIAAKYQEERPGVYRRISN